MAKNKNKLSKRELNFIKKCKGEGKQLPELLKKRIEVYKIFE